ncbi:hypothetical protein Tco_0568987 [Tanacetum coccineum]
MRTVDAFTSGLKVMVNLQESTAAHCHRQRESATALLRALISKIVSCDWFVPSYIVPYSTKCALRYTLTVHQSPRDGIDVTSSALADGRT